MTQTDIHIIYTIYYRRVGLLVVAAYKLLDPDIMDKFLDGPKVRKGSVRNTQNLCFIVRRQQFLL